MNRRNGFFIHTTISCIVLFAVLLSSTPVSADEDLIIYTDYYNYDNNESLDFHLIGTENTTYMLMIFHRDSDAPILLTYTRIPENNTMRNGSIPLYELDHFGILKLHAMNKSNNQSASCEFRLVPSHDWAIRETNRLAALMYDIQFWTFYVLFVTIVIILSGYAYFYLKYRGKVKEQLGESGAFESLWKVLTSPGDYDYYANAVQGERPTGVKAKAELAHMLYKTARWEFLDNLKTIKDAGKLKKRNAYLSRELNTHLVKDLVSEWVKAGILEPGEWEKKTALEKFKYLSPGEIKKATRG